MRFLGRKDQADVRLSSAFLKHGLYLCIALFPECQFNRKAAVRPSEHFDPAGRNRDTIRVKEGF
jgi:hypothetical protein